MSYFIIIRGPLGIGKSTVSKKLVKVLGGKYISMDLLLEKLDLDKVSKNEECIPAKNFIRADEFILPDLKKYLVNDKIIVLDGNFYHKEQIAHLIKKLSNYKHYEFTLKGPLEVCIKRDKNREKSYGELAAKAVYNLVSRFDCGINIFTENKNSNQVVKEILSYLPILE